VDKGCSWTPWLQGENHAYEEADAITGRQFLRTEAGLSRAPKQRVHRHGFYVRLRAATATNACVLSALCVRVAEER
jgi:hypothetical protein